MSIVYSKFKIMTVQERLNNWSTLARLGLASESPLIRDSPILREIEKAIHDEFEALDLPPAEITLVDFNLCTVKVPNGFGSIFWISLRYSKEYNHWVWWIDLEDDITTVSISEISKLANSIAIGARDQLDFYRTRRTR